MEKTLSILFLILGIGMNAQESLDELLKRHNQNKVPYITAEELAMPKTNAILLDAREPSEYATSHLKDAIYVGYDHFSLDSISQKLPEKDQSIVVYCSLGIRSETIADRMKKAGYTDVQNLYGGIFEWKNKEFPVYNSEGRETDSIHTYSKAWSKWLKNGIKVFEKDSLAEQKK